MDQCLRDGGAALGLPRPPVPLCCALTSYKPHKGKKRKTHTQPLPVCRQARKELKPCRTRWRGGYGAKRAHYQSRLRYIWTTHHVLDVSLSFLFVYSSFNLFTPPPSFVFVLSFFFFYFPLASSTPSLSVRALPSLNLPKPLWSHLLKRFCFLRQLVFSPGQRMPLASAPSPFSF